MTTLHLTHIGGPTTLIEADGWRILTDPTFDSPGRTYRFGWGTSSRKLAGPAVPVDQLGHIDVVLLTHEHHADNLDVTGRQGLRGADVVVTTETGARRLGPNARGIGDWDVVRLEAPDRPPLTITATPCRHGPRGSHPIVGDVVGFALTWAGQAHGAVWISGDTVLYDGVRHVADRIDVGTAIVHLGAVRFRITGPLTYTMDVEDALELCTDSTRRRSSPFTTRAGHTSPRAERPSNGASLAQVPSPIASAGRRSASRSNWWSDRGPGERREWGRPCAVHWSHSASEPLTPGLSR